MNVRSRRALGALLSAAAVAGGGGILLATGPASAGNATRIDASDTAVQAAAGTCQIITYTPIDTYGVKSTAPDTLTVTLNESPESATQDIDFCSTGATTPDEAPSYVAGDDNPTGTGPTTQSYTAGPGVTGDGGFTSGGKPDKADDSTQTGTPSSTCCTQANPNGIDRARYVYNGSTPIRVGVVGLTAGKATIKAFFDDGSKASIPPNPTTDYKAGDYKPESTETQAPTVTFTITAGGQPGSTQVADAVTAISVDPVDDAGTPGQQQAFTATLRNSSGDTVRGVTPRVAVASGGANPNSTPSCDESDNSGVSRCTFTGQNPGTDQLTVYVNRAGGTAGVDGNEPRTVITRTTTKPAVPADQARYLDLTPKNATLTSGKSDTFTATITDVNGAPATGVAVTFTESGPGRFSNNTSTISGTTGATGRVSVRVDTSATDVGTETITASISTTGTQCTQQAGAGTGSTSTTPAGRCSDTTTQTISAASPSPTPSGSKSPTPTPSSSPAATTATLTTSTPDIQPNQQGILNASNLRASSTYELRCYSRPDTTYVTARSATTSAGATTLQFTILPGTNTRCYVRPQGTETGASKSTVINVHTTLSLSAYRDGVRKYHFQGTNLPRRPNQLITLYRWARADNNGYCDPHVRSGDYTATSSDPNCIAIRTATAYTNSTNTWRIDRSFTGSGQFVFMVKSGQNLTNAAGVSNLRLTIIH